MIAASEFMESLKIVASAAFWLTLVVVGASILFQSLRARRSVRI